MEHDRRLIRDTIRETDKKLNRDGLGEYKNLECVLFGLERLADLAIRHSSMNGGYQLASETSLAIDKPYSIFSSEGSTVENINHTLVSHELLTTWVSRKPL